jgi:hypothetical protein
VLHGTGSFGAAKKMDIFAHNFVYNGFAAV